MLVASNKLRVAGNMQLVAGNKQLAARNMMLVARNKLRWCKRGIRLSGVDHTCAAGLYNIRNGHLSISLV